MLTKKEELQILKDYNIKCIEELSAILKRELLSGLGYIQGSNKW